MVYLHPENNLSYEQETIENVDETSGEVPVKPGLGVPLPPHLLLLHLVLLSEPVSLQGGVISNYLGVVCIS